MCRECSLYCLIKVFCMSCISYPLSSVLFSNCFSHVFARYFFYTIVLMDCLCVLLFFFLRTHAGLHIYFMEYALSQNILLSLLLVYFVLKNVQKLQKLIYLHLLTDCFMKISLQSSELNVVNIVKKCITITTIITILKKFCIGFLHRVSTFIFCFTLALHTKLAHFTLL